MVRSHGEIIGHFKEDKIYRYVELLKCCGAQGEGRPASSLPPERRSGYGHKMKIPKSLCVYTQPPTVHNSIL